MNSNDLNGLELTKKKIDLNELILIAVAINAADAAETAQRFQESFGNDDIRRFRLFRPPDDGARDVQFRCPKSGNLRTSGRFFIGTFCYYINIIF